MFGILLKDMFSYVRTYNYHFQFVAKAYLVGVSWGRFWKPHKFWPAVGNNHKSPRITILKLAGNNFYLAWPCIYLFIYHYWANSSADLPREKKDYN